MEKIFFVSLGCDKNLVDSQQMLGILHQQGFEMASDENEADVIVVNTCSFIGDARDESIETLLQMGRCRTDGKCRALIAAGCLAQRYQQEILDEMPEVDAVVGTASIEKIADAVRSALSGKRTITADPVDRLFVPETDRVLSTGDFSTYLKIAEGCDKRCTYCIIPSLRGKYRSYPMDYLLAEAKKLAGQGITELNLVAQETTLYGTDLYGRKMLPVLLERLCRIEGISWIRLLYCYPEEITDELLEVMASQQKICHYIDIPIQHASDRILQRMGRRTTRDEICGVIEKLRDRMPDIAIRTTLISGFPGETEQDHEELKSFIRQVRFDRLGVFPYSREEGTPAAQMPGQIPEEIRQKRADELMLLQQEIAFEKARSMKGHMLDVMIEGRLPEEGIYVGRTYMDAPGVDGRVFLEYDGQWMSGQIVKVRVTDAVEYDLIAQAVDGGYTDEFTE